MVRPKSANSNYSITLLFKDQTYSVLEEGIFSVAHNAVFLHVCIAILKVAGFILNL